MTRQDSEPDDPADDQRDRDDAADIPGFAKNEHAEDRRADRADPGPDRICGSDRQGAERDRQQPEPCMHGFP